MLKDCEICGKEFETKGAARYCSSECKKEGQIKVKICVVCGLDFKTKYNDRRTCSRKCADELVALTSLERYGTRNVAQLQETQAKMQATCEERYGTKHAMKNKTIALKTRTTNMERYGVTSPLKNPDILAKAQITNMEKYGNISSLMNEEVRKKSEQTMLETYGYKNAGECPELQEKMRQTNLERYGCEYPGGQDPETRNKIIKTNMLKYNRAYKFLEHITNYENFNEEYIKANFTTQGVATLEDRIRFKEYFNISHSDNALRKLKALGIECEKFFNVSESELKILNYLKENYPELIFIENDRSLIKNPETKSPLEIDIVVKKDTTIICGIEYNGVYWHDKENQEREKLKSQLCLEQGFPLFHVWEDTKEIDVLEIEEFLSFF